jgi:putative transposase
MRKSRFTEAQIIGMIKEQEAGMPTSEVCRHQGLSPSTFYKLKAKYGVRLRRGPSDFSYDPMISPTLQRPAQNPNRRASHAYDFVIHPVWEDGSCQQLCQMRFGRGFRDILRKD